MKKILTVFLIACFFFSLSLLSVAATGNSERLAGLLRENYNASRYTPESYLLYQNAFSQALAVSEKSWATEDEIVSAINALTDARDMLVPLVGFQDLTRCITDLDEILNEISMSVSSEMRQRLIEKRNEIQSMIDQGGSSSEEIINAVSGCDTLLAEARNQLEDIREYSEGGSKEGVVVPTDYIAPSKELGNVTRIRLIIFWVGIGLFLLGIIVVICYLRMAKKRPNRH